MKKLLIILLCLPIIGVGQLSSDIFLKSKSASSGISFSPRFGLVCKLADFDYNIKSNFGLCSSYYLSYIPPDFPTDEDPTFYHSLLLGLSYELNIIRLRLMSGLIHYRSPNQKIIYNEDPQVGSGIVSNIKSKLSFGVSHLIGVSVLIMKTKNSYITVNADRYFTQPIKIETTKETELFLVGDNEITTSQVTDEISISTIFLTIGLTKYLKR